jgi:imidazolonepropionase-like amidohydrolase
MLALTGATLIDGRGGEPLRDAVVVIDGHRIMAVSSGGQVPVPDGAEVLDVGGRTIMPGLIDGHVHLLAYAGEDQAQSYAWNVLTFVEEQTLHAAANARKALHAGVTTVRDMAGSRPEISVGRVIEAGLIEGARVVSAGFVGMTAGHGDMFAPAASDRRIWKTADGPDACRALVREYARDGSDLIKICTSGGVLSSGDHPDWRNFTPQETAAIVDEAHALGKKVAAHAHTRKGILQALDADVDTIEHGTFIDDECIGRMVDQGVWLCPTLLLNDYLRSQAAAGTVPADSVAKSKEMEQGRVVRLRRAREAGVRMFMGTDTCMKLPFGSHARELGLMRELLGMSPMEAIVASTSAAAEALGIAARTGTIEPGKEADLLVVDGDPLADPAVLADQANLHLVLKAGRALERDRHKLRALERAGERRP